MRRNAAPGAGPGEYVVVEQKDGTRFAAPMANDIPATLSYLLTKGPAVRWARVYARSERHALEREYSRSEWSRVDTDLLRDLRRNPPDRPPTPEEIVDIAKDLLQQGDIDGAEAMLRDQAGLTELAIARNLFVAIGQMVDSKQKREAAKIFTVVRKKYLHITLPFGSVRKLVRFDLKTVRDDMNIALASDDMQPKEETIAGVKSFGVTEGGATYGDDYVVVKDEDAAITIAIERVKNDLESEPEIFNRDFLERHVDEKKFAEVVRGIAVEDDYWDEQAASSRRSEQRQFWEEAERCGVDVPEDIDEATADQIEAALEVVKEAQAAEAARDPWQYMRDRSAGDDELWEWVMENVGIDVEAAAEEAVRDDGAGHYLSSYDGRLHDTVSGFWYWRQ